MTFKLLSIKNFDATRFLTLKNMHTNSIETCFDDSVLWDNNNFEFMKVGQTYYCKIKLFGRPVPIYTQHSLHCHVLKRHVFVGNKAMTQVRIDNNEFYIIEQKLLDYLAQDEFGFISTRKDLIQVNDVIHPDLF